MEGDMELIRFKLRVAYDGTAYAGWQLQKNRMTVQAKVEEALSALFPGVWRLHSSSRTDTGVHALGMVAHVDLPRRAGRMNGGKLPLALNAHLPEDIRVTAARRVGGEFHARYDAVGKQYRYEVWNHRAMNPLLRKRAWHVPQALDLGAIARAAAVFVGKHDFNSFAASREYRMASTVRTLYRCEVRRRGHRLTIVMEGDGFLYKMCRGIVGTLVQVGMGKFNVQDCRRILSARDRQSGGMNAPAHGLVLWRVYYRRPTRWRLGKQRVKSTREGGGRLRLATPKPRVGV